MGQTTIIANGTIVNEGCSFVGSIVIQNGRIADIIPGTAQIGDKSAQIIDAQGLIVMPGMIDDQVHFREPGLTHKGDILSESMSAVAGGVTSFMEMPNTIPQTTTQALLSDKFELGANASWANYSFYIGATNDNLDQLLATDKNNVYGIKVFMGSSTGNMLVDNPETLNALFAQARLPIATHCEDEPTIKANLAEFKARFGDDIPLKYHPEIRSALACFRSSQLATSLARKHGTRLHILHLSTAAELELLDRGPALGKQITAEACVHHLWFSEEDYDSKGVFIKWNPSIKSAQDREALRNALHDGRIDLVATDHAPHTLEEKHNIYTKSASGGPLVQHALLAMYDLYKQGHIALTDVVRLCAHAPADTFSIKERGYLRKGYWADIAVLDPENGLHVTKENILYRCQWSPFEGHQFQASIAMTFVNGVLAWDRGRFSQRPTTSALQFSR